MTNKKILDNIIKEYSNMFTFVFMPKGNPYCYLKEKEIHLTIEDFMKCDDRFIFDFLHEIGHLETNTLYMKRYEQEYKATIFALDYCKKNHIKVSDETLNDYQNYIYKWHEHSLKRKAHNVCKKELLILN